MKTLLEPDRDQIEVFVEALFRHAGTEGFVSIRAFVDDGGNKSFRISPAAMTGGFKFLVDVAEDDARRAANDPKRVVFCPPVAVFTNNKHAREEDVLRGLTISVECDEHAQQARALLEKILGPATIVVASGGQWLNPKTGEKEPKLHLHWRLQRPASGKKDLATLKAARELAAALVGGDPSNAPIVHPIRWPGSWHRKGEPTLCRIIAQDPDAEIDLATAHKALSVSAPAVKANKSNGQGTSEDIPSELEREDLIANIHKGVDLHRSITELAAKLVACGMRSNNAAVALLRGIMKGSVARQSRPDDWQARYDDIPRAVRTAREKFGKSNASEVVSTLSNAAEINHMSFNPIKFVVPGYIVEGLTLFAGKPKLGKSWLLLHAAIAVARGGFTLGDVHCQEGDVLYCALEDNLRRLRSRLAKMLQTESNWPRRLNFVTEMPRLAEGGLDYIREWLEKAERPRLVVIDTLAMVRMPNRKDVSTYDADYAAVKDLRALAHQYGVAIVLVHHLRKAEGDDVFDTISGTLGLTGCPDTIAVIRRDTSGTTLHARGRDLPDIEKAVTFNPTTCIWSVLGEAGEVRRSDQRGTIVEALTEAGNEPLGPNQIAAATGMKAGNVRYLLGRMKIDGLVRKTAYGKYELLPSHPHTSPHTPN
jgi:hypothetical protein